MVGEEVPFSDLLIEVIDNRGKTCPTADTGIPLIATNCIRNELLYPTYDKVRFVSAETYSTWFRGHPEPGDIIFVNKATPGRVCLVPDPVGFCIAQDMVAVRADPKKVYPRFLFAVLRSPNVQEQIRQMHVGTLIPHFKKGDFNKLLLSIPCRAVQQFVGDIYFELSAKIDLNRRMNETLEGMARALFKSWFVDFDPVRAKAGGREPGLPKALADLFPDSLVDSELGEIPKGWGTQTASSLLRLDKGLSYKGAYLGDRGVPMVNLGCFSGKGRFNEQAIKRYTGDFQERHKVAPGDLVLANTDVTQKREVLGSPGIVPPSGGDNEFIFTHHVYAVRFNEGRANWRAFVYFALLHDEFRERATGFATGTTVLALPRDAILDLCLPAPPATLVDAFNRAADLLMQRQWAATSESRTLAAIRDTLLPKLISGELRVKNAERIAAQVDG